MTFRGLFLRSAGLEYIINNYLLDGPSPEEQQLLLELFGASLPCLELSLLHTLCVSTSACPSALIPSLTPFFSLINSPSQPPMYN